MNLECRIAMEASKLTMAGCLVAGIIRWRHIPALARLFVVQAGAALLIEWIGFFVARAKLTNHVCYNVYLILEFFVILSAARLFIERRFKLIAIPASATFVAFYCYDVAKTGIFFGVFHAITATYLMLGAIYLFVLIQSLNQSSEKIIPGSRLIATGLMACYLTIAIRFSVFNYIVNGMNEHQIDIIYLILFLFSVIRYSLTGAGIWKMGKSENRTRRNAAATAGPMDFLQFRDQ